MSLPTELCWTPISERMPDIGQIVLVANIHEGLFSLATWKGGGWSWHAGLVVQVVTHFAPLRLEKRSLNHTVQKAIFASRSANTEEQRERWIKRVQDSERISPTEKAILIAFAKEIWHGEFQSSGAGGEPDAGPGIEVSPERNGGG